jgi:hypothetical protein
MSQIISHHKGTVHRRKDVKGIYGEIDTCVSKNESKKSYYITVNKSERRCRGIAKDLDNEEVEIYQI